MKKTLLAVGLFCGLMVMLAGCKTKIDTQALNSLTSLSQITPADIDTRTITFADSVEVNKITGTVKITADFPESGNFFAINNIREWMSEQLGGTYGDAENVDHDIMVNVVKESLDVSFNKPFASGEAVLNHPQCRMATSVRTKAM